MTEIVGMNNRSYLMYNERGMGLDHRYVIAITYVVFFRDLCSVSHSFLLCICFWFCLLYLVSVMVERPQ